MHPFILFQELGVDISNAVCLCHECASESLQLNLLVGQQCMNILAVCE